MLSTSSVVEACTSSTSSLLPQKIPSAIPTSNMLSDGQLWDKTPTKEHERVTSGRRYANSTYSNIFADLFEPTILSMQLPVLDRYLESCHHQLPAIKLSLSMWLLKTNLRKHKDVITSMRHWFSLNLHICNKTKCRDNLSLLSNKQYIHHHLHPHCYTPTDFNTLELKSFSMLWFRPELGCDWHTALMSLQFRDEHKKTCRSHLHL